MQEITIKHEYLKPNTSIWSLGPVFEAKHWYLKPNTGIQKQAVLFQAKYKYLKQRRVCLFV